MEAFLLVVFGWLLGLATAVFGGVERIRIWLNLAEPEPYYTAAFREKDLLNEPVVGPLYKTEKEAGNTPGWKPLHLGPSKENEGYEYIRNKRRKIVYRSKTMAHGDDHVLMVRR